MCGTNINVWRDFGSVGRHGRKAGRAVYASAAYGRRRRTTHRINVITAKSRERGKKVTKAGKVDEKARTGLQLGREDGSPWIFALSRNL